MSYIDTTLLPEEEVTYRTKLHWIIFLRPLLWFIVTLILALYIIIDGSGFDKVTSYFNLDIGVIYKLLPLITLLIGIVDSLAQYIAYKTSEFGVTNKRVIVKIGFIRRTTSENFLTKVENIQVNQSVLGRILGYGTIVLHGTGGTREPFYLIDNPLELRKQIQTQVEASETHS